MNSVQEDENARGLVGIAERREREKAEVRQSILDAARQVILTEGFDALSVRKIAQAIEYAPSTIYLYFETRDDIARQLVREGFAEFLEYLAPAARVEDGWERLEAIGRRYLEFAFQRPQTYRLIFMTRFSDEVFPAEEKIDPKAAEPGERALRILAETIGELQASGRMREVDPAVGAEVLWSAMHGIASLRLTCPEHKFVPLEDAAREMLATIRCGLGPVQS